MTDPLGRSLCLGFEVPATPHFWEQALCWRPSDPTVEIKTLAPAGYETPRGLERLANQSEAAGDVILAGIGRSGILAIRNGLAIGAQTVLALGPTLDIDQLQFGEFEDDLNTLHQGIPSPPLDNSVFILTTSESEAGDHRLSDILKKAGFHVAVTDSKLGASATKLALIQSGWLRWLSRSDIRRRLPPLETLAGAWRRTAEIDLSLDHSQSGLLPSGQLVLKGTLRNKGSQTLVLQSGREAIQIGTRHSLAVDGPPTVDILIALSASALPPNGDVSFQCEISGVRGGYIAIGAVLAPSFWMGDLGFPVLKLELAKNPVALNALAPEKEVATRKTAPLTTRIDVVRSYRLLLGREPENEAAVQMHLNECKDVWDLIKKIGASKEAHRWQLVQALAHFREEERVERVFDVLPTDNDLSQLSAHVQAVWKRFGEAEPFFAALADSRFRNARINSEAEERFYASGKTEVQQFFDRLDRCAIRPAGLGRVFELGCRVGRLAAPFQEMSQSYLGVDIAPSQLDIARRRHARNDGVEFTDIDSFFAGHSEFDLFFSVLALQHWPPPLQEVWLRAALKRVRQGGVAHFQLACLLFDYRFSVRDYLESRIPSGPQSLHALSQRRVLTILRETGYSVVEALPDDRVGTRGVSFTFVALRDRSPLQPEPSQSTSKPILDSISEADRGESLLSMAASSC